MEYKFKSLTEEERRICKHTIGVTEFFWLIIDALYNNEAMSVIRYGDGEYRVIKDAKKYSGKFKAFGDGWNKKLGLLDMDIGVLSQQLIDAGNNCKYLAPSTSGFFWDIYSGWYFFNPRDLYVDIWWYYKFGQEEKNLILNNAKGICYVHNNPTWLVDAARAKKLNSRVDGVKMESYKDIPTVLEFIKKTDCQLIMWAGGPVGKMLGPEIEKLGKVGLDLGSNIGNWA